MKKVHILQELSTLKANRKILLSKSSSTLSKKHDLLELFDKIENSIKNNKADHFIERLPFLYLQIKRI